MEETAPCILVVDDNYNNLQVVCSILRAEGYRFSVATNGQEALERVKVVDPGLILLDLMMPVMNGLEACEALKKDPQTAPIPVIFLTASDQTEHLEKAFELGAVDYVTKPFIHRELVARVATQVEMNRKRQELESKSREQNELLHVLCHDLSNPVNASLSMIEMCVEDADEAEDLLPVIKGALTQCRDLIDLVRQTRALEEKKRELAMKVRPLKSLFEVSMSIVEPGFRKKGIALKVEVSDDLCVRVEPTAFVNSVMNNLLTNALKFSFAGSEVRVEALAEGDSAVVRVRDHGVGMPESMLEAIFDPLKRTSRRGTADESGTGFGLPLVKKYIDAFGGTISVTSRERETNPGDHGTTFSLTLPRVSSDELLAMVEADG